MSEFNRGSTSARVLRDRLVNVLRVKATTIVTAENLLRGRLAQTAKARSPQNSIEAYVRLHEAIAHLKDWTMLPFDGRAVAMYDRLRASRLGVGTMDLRIAGIAIANNATLLSRNLRDFERVPGLTVEDWLQ